jgi:phosphoglycolate phosphatase-like HAD superfamily hydrolase
MIEDKIVLSDLDKTIVDINEHLVERLCYAMGQRKLRYDRERLEKTNNIYLELAKSGVSKTDQSFWSFFNEIDNREKGIEAGMIRLFPDAPEFLEFLKKTKAAVVSDTPWLKAESEVRHFGLDRYIRVFCHWDAVKRNFGKPNPFLAMEAAARLSITSRDRFYFVGDDIVDIDCAYNLERELRKKVVKIHVNRNSCCLHGADFTVPNLAYAREIIEWD